MKIVYLSPSGQLGGAERMLLDVLASVHTAQPEWSLHLIISDEGPLISRAVAVGIPTTVVPFPPTLARMGDAGAGGPAGNQFGRFSLLRRSISAGCTAALYVKRLRQVLRELAPNVIHTNGFKMHVLGVLAAPARIPIVWHIHDYVQSRPIMSRLLRRLSSQCAVAITNSQSVAEDMRAVCGEHLRIKTIYNGIDVERFSPEGPALDLDALAGLPPALLGTIKVGLIGTLARWKGHETFLRALAMLPADLPVRGYVTGGPLYQTVGSQSTLEELKNLAAQLGISHRVGFTGFVDNSAAAMRALDILVHASTQPEPFGLVIVEGLACGRAVIASNAGGVTELIESGVHAFSHAPGNTAKLAHHITELATNHNLRARLGAAGRVIAERRFNRARLATELIPIYRSVTS